MAATNLDAADLAAVDLNGLINEEVMQEIFMIDPVDLPYQDMAEVMDSHNQFKEWTQDELAPPALANAIIDGADADGDDSIVGRRIGNHHQISDREVHVSDRARNVDTIGRSDELIYQLMNRQKDLKKQMEATLVSNQGAQADDGNTTPGRTAGCGALFETNIINGTAGGYGTTTPGIYDAPTPGAAAALTETNIRDANEAAYTAGGNPTLLMSTPPMIRKLSEYMFTASARIATIQSDVGQNTGQGRYGHQGVTAVGSVNVFISDFGTLEFIPNRSQLTYTNVVECVNVYGFDVDYWGVSYLQGIETKPLARTGLAEKRQMSVDYCNIAKQEKSSFVIMGIDPTLAVTA